MSDCDKQNGKCPPRYKNIGSESFGDGKKVTAELLYQFCKNDSYLYDQVKSLWDKTDPEHRKRFYPPYYLDSSKSYGVEPIDISDVGEVDKLKFGKLDTAYHLSNTRYEEYNVDFDYTNDKTYWKTSSNGSKDTLVIDDDSIIEDSSTLRIVYENMGTDESPQYEYTVLPTPTSKEVVGDVTFKVMESATSKTTKKTTTKTDVYGKLQLDAKCSGPYKNWHANSVWYIGYNRHKNYNVKNKWRKNSDTYDIPSVCRGQTFKAEHTGELRKVVLLMKGSSKSVSPCIVEIRSVTKKGKPSTKVLARTEQKFNHSSKTLVNFTFKKPCKVKKGVTYAIVVRSPLSNFNHCYWLGGWASTCFSNSRKRAYYKGETFLSENNGKTWITHGKKEKCYGSHYYDWGFAEAPVNFGFEVYIAPKTGTKTTTKVIPVTTNTVVEKIEYEHPSVLLNYYEAGDYYLEFKPFTGNFYSKIMCICTQENNLTANTGYYTWEWYDNDNKQWVAFEDINSELVESSSENFSNETNSVESKDGYVLEFKDKLATFIKVRLKFTLDENVLVEGDKVEDNLNNILTDLHDRSGNVMEIHAWLSNVYDQFAWATNNNTPLKIAQIKNISFYLTKNPSYKGYLRTLEYHPVQEGMLPACIWSEVDVDAETKNNGSVSIDIIHEKTAMEHFTFYTVDNLELAEYIVDYEQNYKPKGRSNISVDDYTKPTDIRKYILGESYNSIQDQGFLDYLQEQDPKIYLLPYNNIYLFGDKDLAPVELDDYPAYPLNGCNIGMEDIHINIEEALNNTLIRYGTVNDTDKSWVKYTETMNPDDVKEVYIKYGYHLDDVDDTEEADNVGMVKLERGKDYKFTSKGILYFGVTQNINNYELSKIIDNTYRDGSNNYLSEDNLPPLALRDFKQQIGTSDNEVDIIDLTETEIVVEMNGYDYNEFQDFIVDYDNKTINFYNPKSLVEGELNVNYNPLWVRGLSVDDFPLKMDLWTEYYRIRLDGEDTYFDKMMINECGEPTIRLDEYTGETYIITSVPPLDNIRDLYVIDSNGNIINDKLIEDIDFEVDYVDSTITFNYNFIAEDGLILVIKYTPNLVDNGLSLGYRLRRPIYDGQDNEVEEAVYIDNSYQVHDNKTNGDDVYCLSNYFTTRT